MIGRTQPKSDDDRLGRSVVEDEGITGELEFLLEGMEFMREELASLPASSVISSAR